VLPAAVLSCHFTQFLQYNHRPLLTTLFPCSVPSSHRQALCPRLHNTCLRSSKHCDAALFFSHHTKNFSFKPSGWKLETNLAAFSVIAKSSLLNYTFTRLWTLHLTAILGQTDNTHAASHCLSMIRVITLGLAHNTACLLALAVMWTTAAGMKCAGGAKFRLNYFYFF